MKGTPMYRNYGKPFTKDTGKPDVKDVLSYLENDGKAQTAKEAGVALGAVKEQHDNINKGASTPGNYRFGATEDEKAQEAEHRLRQRTDENAGSILGNLKNK